MLDERQRDLLSGRPLTPADHEERTVAIDGSMRTMVQLIVDHEYYAPDYSAKDQSHAANLLQTLHDSLVRHDRFAREREAAGKSCADMDRARRLLQSLVCATNRRLHKRDALHLRVPVGEAQPLLLPRVPRLVRAGYVPDVPQRSA